MRDCKPDEKKFSFESNIRGFTYTAFIKKKTGRLMRITTGCRNWKSFEEARNHYRGHTPNRPEWSDAYILRHLSSILDLGASIRGLTRYSEREEARAILRRLNAEVDHYRWLAAGRRKRKTR
jgi:hypothetical protein